MNSPMISASFCQATTVCHSVRSWNCPLWSLNRSLVARLNLATAMPLAVYFHFRIFAKISDKDDLVYPFIMV